MIGLKSLVLGLCGVALAALWTDSAMAERRVALVIGNSSYEKTTKLLNPANDAPDMAKALGAIGFEVIERTDLDKRGLDMALAEFSRKATGADSALFFFAGHGLQYQGRNYLLPIDADLEDDVSLRYQTTPIEDVRAALDRAAGVKILILDACRNNPFSDRLTRSAGLTRSTGLTRGLARLDRTEGMVVAYATQADQVAQDGSGRNSPFAGALINRLSEPGLEIATMFRRVAQDVFEKTNGRQRPELSISLLSDYFLNLSDTDTMVWGRIRDSQNPADFEAFIDRYPASPFAREAQFRLDLFDRIKRENEERKRLERERLIANQERERQDAAEAEAARLAAIREDAQREAERIAAEKAAAAARETERLAQERQQAEERRLAEERKAAELREAERVAAQKRDAEDAARIAQLADAERKKQEEELAKRRIAETCRSENEELKRLTDAGRREPIDAFRTDAACPTIKPAIDKAVQTVVARLKRTCDAERKSLSAIGAKDLDALKSAAERLTCEPVQTAAAEQIAGLEADILKAEQTCEAESTRIAALTAQGYEARPQLVSLQKELTCARAKPIAEAALKHLDTLAPEIDTPRLVTAAQTELARLGCYAGKPNGRLNKDTKQALSDYLEARGSILAEVRITEDFIGELKGQHEAVCPEAEEDAPAVATPAPSPRKKAAPVASAPTKKARRPAVARVKTPATTRPVRETRRAAPTNPGPTASAAPPRRVNIMSGVGF